jgi:glycosyltransferase involved in cell wall biosynthesis
MAHLAIVDDLAGSDPVKPWRVLHVCETASTIATVAEAQSDAGMQPKLLAREYWRDDPVHRLSLLTAWNDVRDWRHALNEAEALSNIQLVHAHTFASAMAGVRGALPVIYDFYFPLEDIAEQQAHNNPWLLRSFRVAEQFALSHASAVVTHSTAMSTIAHDRGASAKNIFVIPQPFDTDILAADLEWAARFDIKVDSGLVVLASLQGSPPQGALTAFASLLSEISDAVLLLELDSEDDRETMHLAARLGIANSVRIVPPSQTLQAIACADLVIVSASEGNDSNPVMLTAMAAAKPVVAADSSANRDCSPDGRGCVWYRSGNALDLEHRLTFVARNEDFRRALAQAARDHIRLTRGFKAIARQYDEVYQHAFSRRTEPGPRISMPRLYSLGNQETI